MQETDLYPPLKTWLEAQGYLVRGEVGRCDLAARKNDELIVVEMKIRASMALLAQAVERQEYADAVYIALPASPERRHPPNFRNLNRLLSRLGIGLILVTFLKTRSTVEVLRHPADSGIRHRPKKKAAILREISGRHLDLTPGGLAGAGQRISSYRQRAIRLATWLSELGESSAAELRRRGAPDDCGAILSRNLYGWIIRVNRGRYTIHPCGLQAIEEVPELRGIFRNEL